MRGLSRRALLWQTLAAAAPAGTPVIDTHLEVWSFRFPFSHPERVRQTLNNLFTLYRRVTPYFVHIPVYGATWGFAVASDVLDIHLDRATVDARLVTRGIVERQLYNGATHEAMLALPEYAAALVR